MMRACAHVVTLLAALFLVPADLAQADSVPEPVPPGRDNPRPDCGDAGCDEQADPGAAQGVHTPAAHPVPGGFKAAEAVPERPVPASGDLPAMLQSCDAQLRTCEQGAELCEKDRTGVGFLGAAYVALWVILLVFFLAMRNRQRRLMADLRTLQARLAKLQGGD